jgi:hypothetical protein
MASKKKFVNLFDYEHIRSAIFHYGFCATLEVSNGSYRKKKKRQVDMSKDFISALSHGTGSCEFVVMQGIAVIKHAVSAKNPDLDFVVGISQLDNSILRGVSFDALNSPYLCLAAKRSLERLLQVSEEENKSMYYLIGANHETHVGEIKGVLLELYVKKLIDVCFGSSWRRIFSRVEFYSEKRQLGETDLIVVSEEDNFRAALSRLKCLDHVKVY